MARTQRMRRLGGGFRSRARKLMAICLGGVVLLSAGHAVAEKGNEAVQNPRLQRAGEASTMKGPVFLNGVATCTLTTSSVSTVDQPAATALTLSRDNLTATLNCFGQENSAVPAGLTKVCDPNQVGSEGNCTFGEAQDSDGNNAQEVTVQALLGAAEDIKWKQEESATEQAKNGETWTLALTDDDLPFTDKPFFVGCKENKQSPAEVAGAAATDSCKVPVHVEARPSSETNNVVTCAYGQNSNTNALEVELTAEKNAVTIDCGSVGSLMPGITTTHYCAPDDGNLDDCTAKNYVDVLPMFEESWVKQDGEKSSVTLTILESGFPVEDQKLRLGCVPKSTSATKSDPGSPADAFGAKTSSCNVIVTVRASNTPSSAISTLQVTAVASGAVAVAGLLGGSL
uniref:SRS domain-containing protein n=1 Tax=Neospora caninum (strain Liverpool) TaxID=572307 RepID=F0JB67_NEOCL|nr:SRS domain-containing protein [Neospora caninum Liverpool]CEL71334.1 TPA: SRS domain-containing protein [Neospora caninum Liverpool]